MSIDDPRLILAVGGLGLAINLIGLFLFGEVGHGHSHGGADGGGEGHSHGFQENDSSNTEEQNREKSQGVRNLIMIMMRIMTTMILFYLSLQAGR